MVGHRDVEVRSVAIDSRRVGRGDLFVAIRGQLFDGHQFIREAVSKGAAGLIVSNKSMLDFQDTVGVGGEKPFVIVVPDSVRALQLMGRFVRLRFGGVPRVERPAPLSLCI